MIRIVDAHPSGRRRKLRRCLRSRCSLWLNPLHVPNFSYIQAIKTPIPLGTGFCIGGGGGIDSSRSLSPCGPSSLHSDVQRTSAFVSPLRGFSVCRINKKGLPCGNPFLFIWWWDGAWVQFPRLPSTKSTKRCKMLMRAYSYAGASALIFAGASTS